ncbi:MAG: choice-of-anchor D domain-containing protein [Ignavibacteria bacterium]|nr:choice-of-anchor D domain-containing protein [Ignavibacteria bacterium]
MPLRTLLLFSLCALLLAPPTASGQSTCDADKSCTGNALLFPGGDLDYVDVFNTPVLNSIDTSDAMSIVLWANVARRPGVAQYIGGVWGPRMDRDDKWLLYVGDDDSLTFELSNDATNLGQFDNTVVKTAMPYGRWLHIAAMWDGATQEARLYIDGTLVARGRNADYPVAKLRPTISYLQFGSFNGMTNDPSRTKTLTGTLDEIRLYNRVIPEAQLRCERYASLRGNETGLILYLRLNETGGDILCDASRWNGRGNRRGSLQFAAPTRAVPQSVFITPAAFTFALGCISDTTLTVAITDTSACGQQVTLSLSGKDAAAFSLGVTSATLQQNQTLVVPIRTNIRITGSINATLTVQPLNSCNPTSVIPISITRNTQLGTSMGRLVFDTLFGCVSRTVSDTTLRICNNSGGPLTVSSLSTVVGAFTATPVGWTLPLTLQPGDCRDVLLRFAPPDTGSYADTLRIASTDICPGSGLIPLSGRSVDIARTTISSVDFDRPQIPCRRSLNLAEEFFLRNMTGENFTVEAIEFNDPAFSTPTVLPLTARPGISYRMYIRFRSSVEGFYRDTARIRMNFRGCTVYRSIPLTGRIVDVKLAPADTLVDFGNVIVGQSATLPVSLSNNGIDSRDVFMYLSSGRVFSIAGANRFTLAPAGSRSVNVTFRPLSAAPYRDTLNFQDVGCQIIKQVILTGNGMFGSLVFQPPYLQASGVINCLCRVDTVTVTNNTGAPLTLRSVSISGSTKFTFLAPAPVPNEVLQPGQRRSFHVQYCPAGAQDFVTETADLVFDTDGPEGTLRMLMTGTNIEPKLTIEAATNFGDVEVGTAQTRVLHLTNPSPTPVRVDAIPPLPAGFSVVSAAPPVGSTLQYRDTMLVTVQFAPPTNTTYSGTISASSTNPCPVGTSGALTGRGIIVPLFVPWSTIVFSEVTRCDSVLRVIGLVNDGSVPIRVDSIWITGRDSLAFDWRGRTFSGAPPRDTPPRFADSLDIIYHPDRSPNVQSQAQIKITATTRLGRQTFTINLVGGRIQQYIPSRNAVLFPATPVRNPATPISVSFQNPSYLETLYIDSLSFVQNQGVFSFAATLPLAIAPRQTRAIAFGFTPRAAITYTAKIRLSTRVSCAETDTTIVISGDGYTPPWLTTVCLDSNVTANIGDVLRLPVFLNRPIPQNPLDVDLFIGFHRRALQYLGFEPVFTQTPAFDTLRTDGVKVTLRGNQNVVSGPIGYISFRVAASDSMQFFLRTDSVGFASDSTLFIALFGDGCIKTMTINPRCGVQRLSFSTNHYELKQNYPNPFTATTTIEFETLEDVPVRIEVRDTRGRTVAVLADGFTPHGRYLLVFDGSALPTGTYSLLMITPNFTASRTMMVVK